jgi:hypothetical protein
MKYFSLAPMLAFALFICCQSNTKNNNESDIVKKNDLTREESDYIQKRDEYIDQLQGIQKRKSPTDSFDSLYNADGQAMKELEGKLKKILQASHFRANGDINLETLLGYIGFGMLDGLRFNKDSTTRIFYTTKNLFFQYAKKGDEHSFDKWSANDFASVFNSAFQMDVHVDSYSFLKLPSTPNMASYGMLAMLSQMIGPFTPQHIYVLVSKDDFIYMAEITLKDPLDEIPQCKAEWDRIHTDSEKKLEDYRASDLKDTASFNQGIELDETAFKKYQECYNLELKRSGKFAAIQKQMELMASYLAQP